MLKMLSSDFFLPTKNFRYLSVLLAIHHNSDISQHGIAEEVGMSSAMVNGYVKEMKSNDHLLVINKNARDKNYQLTENGKVVLMEHLMNCSAEIVHLYSKAKVELIEKLKSVGAGNNNIRVILFGGSDTAQMVVSALELIPNYQIISIVDNNEALWGKSIGGYEIQDPETMRTHDFDCVIIATFAKQNEIYQSLKFLEQENKQVIRLSTL